MQTLKSPDLAVLNAIHSRFRLDPDTKAIIGPRGKPVAMKPSAQGRHRIALRIPDRCSPSTYYAHHVAEFLVTGSWPKFRGHREG